jgi:DNA end-binding protein Ku
MRAVWKGTIGFGAFAIPVKAYAATEEHRVSLNQVHEVDGGRIRLRRFCEVDGAEVPAEETARGYQVPGGDVVVLTEQDFASLPLSTLRSIDVCGFAPFDQIDPVYYAKSYYLEPESAATKPYVLLSEALQQSGRVGVVKVALRQRETLGVLRVRDQVIILETMLWPDEVRTPDFPFQHEDVDLSLPEVRAAVAMIEALAGDFEPRRYTDNYRAALQELIDAKIDGAEVVQPTAPAQNEGVSSLLEALQRSVENVTGTTPVEKARAASRKAAGAKATAKRTAAKTRGSTAKTQR